MKRIAIVFFLAASSGLFAAANHSGWQARLDVGGLFPADRGYRATYGEIALQPRLELTYGFSPRLGVWAGFSMLRCRGAGSLTGIPAKSSQQHVACGLSYSLPSSGPISLRLAAGPMLSFYSEEAGIWKASGSLVGIDASAAVDWRLSKVMSVEGRLGYQGSSGRSDFGGTFTLGGIWLGAGIVYRF